MLKNQPKTIPDIQSPIKFRIILENEEIPENTQIEDNVEIYAINYIRQPIEHQILQIQKEEVILSDSDSSLIPQLDQNNFVSVGLPNLNESSILLEDSECSDSSIYFEGILEKSRSLRDYSFLNISKKKLSILKTTIKRAVSKFDEEYNSRHFLRYTKYNNILTKLYKHFKYFHIYMNLLKDSMLENNSSTAAKRPKIVDAMSTSGQELIDSSPTTNKRIINKNQRLLDSERSILLKESLEEIEEKDAVYAQNFYDKIEEKYTLEGKPEKFEEFVEILNNFDQKNDKVPDLYRKLEKLFLPEHPEFAETFISILLPGHAAQIGKFIEHSIATNMNTFCNKLNIYFKKQPAQTRRIYACINELSNDTNVTMDTMKLKILPLLKGNQLLIDWFLEIFPSERIPESTTDEYESLIIKNNLTDDGTDTECYETILQNDLMPDPVENSPCGTKYIQGRIHYGSRFPLPGRLSFLAFDEETTSIQHIEPSTTTATAPINECIHAIRKTGDEKLLEMNLTNSEIISSLNAIHGNENDDDDNETEILPNLCNTTVLRAHGIRLNPAVHGSNITNPAEVLKILTIPESEINFNEISYLKDSPTKQITKNYKKNPASPIVKKNKSPINRKSSLTLSLVCPDSPAIAISRKLKSLVETDNSEDEKSSIGRRNSIKKSPKTDDDSESDSGKNRTPKSKGKKRSKRDWSREEDKIILEEIKNVSSVEGELVDRLIGQLKYRSLSEITERSNFLEDFLRQFQNS